MTVIETLREKLAALSLTAVDQRLEALLEQAAKEETSYGDFLHQVLVTELDARRQRYLKTRLQLAHLPYVKTFEQFDFGFQPSLDERQVRELRTLRFVHEASNVILLGPPGVGKTHLAVALADTLENLALWTVMLQDAASPAVVHLASGLTQLKWVVYGLSLGLLGVVMARRWLLAPEADGERRG